MYADGNIEISNEDDNKKKRKLHSKNKKATQEEDKLFRRFKTVSDEKIDELLDE